MLTYEIAITLSIASRLEMYLTNYVRAREDLSLLILRIAISDLETASCLGTVLLNDVMLYRGTNINIEIIAASSGRYLSARLARGLSALLGLIFLLRLYATEASSVRAADIAMLIRSLEDGLRVIIVGRATEARSRTVRLID